MNCLFPQLWSTQPPTDFPQFPILSQPGSRPPLEPSLTKKGGGGGVGAAKRYYLILFASKGVKALPKNPPDPLLGIQGSWAIITS